MSKKQNQNYNGTIKVLVGSHPFTKFDVHRKTLLESSPFMRSEWRNRAPKPIIIHNGDPTAFGLILDFLYGRRWTGDYTSAELTRLQAAYLLADSLSMEVVQDEIMDSIRELVRNRGTLDSWPLMSIIDKIDDSNSPLFQFHVDMIAYTWISRPRTCSNREGELRSAVRDVVLADNDFATEHVLGRYFDLQVEFARNSYSMHWLDTHHDASRVDPCTYHIHQGRTCHIHAGSSQMVPYDGRR